jgi:phosphoribosyl 1,2-cyclic phosphodiesterase
MMRITTFASGSTGNCTLVTAGGANILIDAGISMKKIKACLTGCGLSPQELDGVFITHEHSDHISGLSMLLKHYDLPVYAPRTVGSRLMGMLPEMEDRLRVIHTSVPVTVGDMAITSFHTMHDTPESVGYRIDAEVSFGFCTDLGCVTDEVKTTLCGVTAAVIESNHDEEMLRYGSYPVYLKRRILSERGHLSNVCGGDLAGFLAENGAETLVLGHLSRENNTPKKAYDTVSASLAASGCAPRLFVAPPFEPLFVEVGAKCSV